MTRTPPFHADHVGSLLRPAQLVQARRAKSTDLKSVEDEAIRAAVAKQEAIGLQSVTDGEFRRDYWHLDFMKQLDGVTLKAAVGMTFAAEDVPPMATVTGKLKCSTPIMVDHFSFLKSAAKKTAKFCMPSPGSLHFRGGRNAISRAVYPEIAEFWQDASAAWRQAIAHLAAAGCTYLQIDDVGFSYLCDAKVRENFRANGDDPAGLQFTYAQAINRALEGRPKNLRVTMHTCRGNFRSAWFASGGYQDEVLDGMFSADVDGFFMEYDSERAGSFEPLARLPKGKNVVLGLVSTKTGALEGKDELKKRIDEAARYVPLENLRLSPQCGFSSTHHGNKLTEDEQWRKLERVVEVAREIWG
jgi:5-methyltetrahydropteroyltriglutamate--homocysteine methyltransferase